MQPIHTWLQGSRNFATGRIIYGVYGSDDRLKALLRKGYSAQALKMLTDALTAITTEVHVPIYTPPADQQAEMPDSSNPVLAALRDEWMPLYKKMNYLISQLDRFGDDNGTGPQEYRREIASEVLALEQQIMKIWARRDAFARTGQLPEVKPASQFKAPEDPVQLGMKIQSHKKAIRRYKQWLRDKPDDPNRAKWVVKLQQYQDELKLLTNA